MCLNVQLNIKHSQAREATEMHLLNRVRSVSKNRTKTEGSDDSEPECKISEMPRKDLEAYVSHLQKKFG